MAHPGAILGFVPYRLNLAALRPHELARVLRPAERLVARPYLAAARALGRPVLAPDEFPEELRLRVAAEPDWDALGASLDHARAARELRDAAHEMGFRQVGAFRLEGLPVSRNFFAYVKEVDVLGAIYMGDARGEPPYLELATLARSEREGRVALLTTSARDGVPLDAAARVEVRTLPSASAEQLFQVHRAGVLAWGRANRPMATVEDFTRGYLDVWGESYEAWKARGLLVPAPTAPARTAA